MLDFVQPKGGGVGAGYRHLPRVFDYIFNLQTTGKV